MGMVEEEWILCDEALVSIDFNFLHISFFFQIGWIFAQFEDT
jgi:hypothetical protein